MTADKLTVDISTISKLVLQNPDDVELTNRSPAKSDQHQPIDRFDSVVDSGDKLEENYIVIDG